MRILILCPEYRGSGGGIMTYYRGLATALRSAGMQVHVLEGSAYHAPADWAPTEEDGVVIEALQADRLESWFERFKAYAAAPGFRRHLAAAWAMWEQANYGADADIVEACDWGLSFVPGVIDAVRPIIVQCHGSIGQISQYDPMAGEGVEDILVRLIEKAVIASAANVQTYCRANADFWQRETGRSISVMHPAWSRPELPAPGGQSGRGLVIGRLQRWKGPAVLCDALRTLGERAPSMDWIGRDTPWAKRDGSTAAHLARNYPDLWATKFVHHSPVSSADVAKRQAEALFNVVCSEWDVFNFTVVEAMASGRPVIVSTGAGASEFVADGVNGYLFPVGDAKALSSAIARVMSDSPTRRAAMGRAAQETIRFALDPHRIATERITAYRNAIADFATKKTARVDGWLAAACRPADTIANELAFLESFPLRPLAKHVVERISRRVRQQ